MWHPLPLPSLLEFMKVSDGFTIVWDRDEYIGIGVKVQGHTGVKYAANNTYKGIQYSVSCQVSRVASFTVT